MLWTWALSRRSCNAYSVGLTLCIAVITDSTRALFLSFYVMCFKMYRVVRCSFFDSTDRCSCSSFVSSCSFYSFTTSTEITWGEQETKQHRHSFNFSKRRGFETRKIHSYALCLWVMIIRRKKHTHTHKKPCSFVRQNVQYDGTEMKAM